MAKETVTRLIDDIDGTDAVSTIQFTWSAVAYEIDLSEKNRREFEQALAKYVAAAHRVSGSARRLPASKALTRKADSAPKLNLEELRAWAKDNGHKVADRGRIPAAVVEAFHAAKSAITETIAPETAPSKAPAGKAPAKAPARRAPAKKAPTKNAESAPKRNLDEVRAWAKGNGHKVADRGRIPAAVVEAFRAATAAVTDAVTPAAAPAKKSPAKKARARAAR